MIVCLIFVLWLRFYIRNFNVLTWLGTGIFFVILFSQCVARLFTRYFRYKVKAVSSLEPRNDYICNGDALLISSYSSISAKIRNNVGVGVADVPCEPKKVTSNHVRAPSVFSTVFLKKSSRLGASPEFVDAVDSTRLYA